MAERNKPSARKPPIAPAEKAAEEAAEEATKEAGAKKSSEKSLPSSHHGHRKRLRERFAKDLGETMPDYELLELVLSLGLPRRDVKPLAKQLIKQFKNFARVIAATPEALREVKGLGEAGITAIKLIESASKRFLQKEVVGSHVLTSWDRIMEYCLLTIGYEARETMHILFLDSRSHLIKDERIASGTVNKLTVYPREIVGKILQLGASAIIMVHNHPSGDISPSKADIDMTEQFKTVLSGLDIKLHDHLIISPESLISFRNEGLL